MDYRQIVLCLIIVCVSAVSAYRRIVCEHSAYQTVRCPKGTYIQMTGGFYGRTSRHICGRNSRTNCYSYTSGGVMNSWCNGKQSCVLKPKNTYFGDPCRGVRKYIVFDYRCHKLPYPSVLPANTLLACEHQVHKSVSCPAGMYINVRSAFYGRTNSKICGRNSRTNCRSAKSTGIIKSWCQGKQSCVLRPENKYFGDPCRGVVKYIYMVYNCKKRQIPAVLSQNSIMVCEGQSVKISCQSGKNILMTEGFYGRDNTCSCKRGNVNNTKCKAGGSYQKLQRSCNNKNSCLMTATNSVFGDPCRGVGKFIRASFSCL